MSEELQFTRDMVFGTGKAQSSVCAVKQNLTNCNNPDRKQSPYYQTEDQEEKERKQINIGTRVTVRIKGDKKYGIIRWIGDMNHRLMAGVEMVSFSSFLFKYVSGS